MAERFAAAVRDVDGVAVIDLSGDLDGGASGELARAWAEAAELDASRVVLDFTSSGYMNSTGIALIVELLGRARAAGRQLGARGLSEHYRAIFEITRLADFIAIEDPEVAGAA